jgi:hypothetical protein
LPATCDEKLDRTILMEELMIVLDKSKSVKAAGPQDRLFNVILENEKLPEEWAASKTIMLFKKGDPSEPGNYRPITLLNASMKIFMHILTSHLTEWAEKHNVLQEE